MKNVHNQEQCELKGSKLGMAKIKEMVYDWATGKQEAEDCFPVFEKVLFLKCREMKSHLWEAIDDQL